MPSIEYWGTEYSVRTQYLTIGSLATTHHSPLTTHHSLPHPPHLLRNPLLQLAHVHRGQLANIGTQPLSVLDVNMADFLLRFVGVPVHKNPDAPPQTSGHVHLICAQQRHIDPSELA